MENHLQMATGVGIGMAFSHLTATFTKAFVTPMLGILGDTPSFRDYYFTFIGSEFRYGELIDSLITFCITAGLIRYGVIVPLRYFAAKEKKLLMRDCPECMFSISKKATRCPYCTSKVDAMPPDKTSESRIINARFEVVDNLKRKISTPYAKDEATGSEISNAPLELADGLERKASIPQDELKPTGFEIKKAEVEVLELKEDFKTKTSIPADGQKEEKPPGSGIINAGFKLLEDLKTNVSNSHGEHTTPGPRIVNAGIEVLDDLKHNRSTPHDQHKPHRSGIIGAGFHLLEHLKTKESTPDEDQKPTRTETINAGSKVLETLKPTSTVFYV